MKKLHLTLPLAALVCASLALAKPPKDPKAKAIYDHDKEWLSHSPNSFIATNIRGEDMQYAERRQAALDLIRERSDKSVTSELMEELRRKSFLSSDICDAFADWKMPQTTPLLKQVAADPKRPKDVRKKARLALKAMQTS